MMWSAFILGLFGSLHCAAMCGPLMLGLSTKNYSLFAFLVHHLGRWIGYIILALLFYGIVSPLYIFELQQYVALVSGILLILFGLKSYIKPINALVEWFSSVISTKMINSKYGRTGNLFLGVLNGLLPCGLSFSAAILSVNAGGIANTSLYMVLFGLGTLPVLLAISYLPAFGKNYWIAKINLWIPRAMLLAGFLLIIRSAGLGIPYLSPAYNADLDQMECCEPVD